MIREDQHCRYMRKPSKIASSRGEEQSFLDVIFDLTPNPSPSRRSLLSLKAHIPDHVSEIIQRLGLTRARVSHHTCIERLRHMFSRDQEYGLLNRLDTPTQGFLYFAKSLDVYESWKARQADQKIQKYYLARVAGHISTDWEGRTLSRALAHHRGGKRMLVIDAELLGSRRKRKIKGKHLPAQTHIIQVAYDETADISTLLICLHKGRRHQIRAHLAHVGLPIIGDQLYGKGIEGDELGLVSVGCVVKRK